MRLATTALALAACALWTLPAHAANPTGSPDDHFLCYKSKVSRNTPKFAQTTLSLSDSIESGSFDLKKPFHICNPADNEAEGIIDAATHLETYKIKATPGSPKHVRQTNIRVVNQLGSLYVDTIKPDYLLVPTAVDLSSPPAVPGTNNVDAYKCYKVRVSKGTIKFPRGVQRSIADQFTPAARELDIKTPKHLCVPVSIAGAPIKNASGHLMCYKAKPAKGEPKHVRLSGVHTNSAELGAGTLDTIKEDELCVPSVVNPVCGDGAKNQDSEDCDGADDSACPGQCTPLCACPSTFPFNIDPNNSLVDTRGAIGYGVELPLAGLSGQINVSIGGQYSPGVYEIYIPTASLPPVDVFGVATVCVYLQEDPARPGSGISGSGVLTCYGNPPPAPFPASPDLRVHVDHCTNGTSCDSGSLGTDCGINLGAGSKLSTSTNLCVPAAPEDLTCSATDPTTQTSALLESTPHAGVCNSPLIGTSGTTPWLPGDAFAIVNVAIDIQGPGSNCSGGPTSQTIQVPLTTANALTTIMDAFPTQQLPGTVQALEMNGSRFSCPQALSGNFSGAALVSAVSILDQSALSSNADINAGIVFTAQ